MLPYIIWTWLSLFLWFSVGVNKKNFRDCTRVKTLALHEMTLIQFPILTLDISRSDPWTLLVWPKTTSQDKNLFVDGKSNNYKVKKQYHGGKYKPSIWYENGLQNEEDIQNHNKIEKNYQIRKRSKVNLVYDCIAERGVTGQTTTWSEKHRYRHLRTSLKYQKLLEPGS